MFTTAELERAAEVLECNFITHRPKPFGKNKRDYSINQVATIIHRRENEDTYVVARFVYAGDDKWNRWEK
jgi:hypothetical protein